VNSLFPPVIDHEVGKGILTSQELQEFRDLGRISASQEIRDAQIQPASIDLRLGREAFRLRASFLPGRSSTLLNKATAPDLLVNRVALSEDVPVLLEPGKVYVVPLMETVTLPPDVQGVANPKSTTGRLDIFTRLITEYGSEFDRVPRNYSGALYVEIVSRTFPVAVKAGMRLNQLRLIRGNPAPAGDTKLRELAKGNLVIQDDEESGTGDASIDGGWPITVDLEGNGSSTVAYKAKKHTPPIELDRVNHYPVDDFWDTIERPSKGRIVLDPDGFYILASKRTVRVPPEYAAEMVPYDPAMGEFRVHYAGFFDPGFGYGSSGEIPGTRAVLEVRAHEMPVLLEHDQLVGRLLYYRMAGVPDRIYGLSIGSSYQQQGLALSKQFKRPDSYSSSGISGPALNLATA